MLPGSVGSRWMPRKIAGIAMITIDVSIVAIIMLSVVLESATHLYLPLPASACPDADGGAAGAGDAAATGPRSDLATARTLARLRIWPEQPDAGGRMSG